MQDRPNVRELLDAVRGFLEEQVVPALEGTRQFHARVAANVLAIVSRELACGDAGLRTEWAQLTALLEMPAASPPESGAALAEAVRALITTLAERIRAGDADSGSWRERVLTHLRMMAEERLAIANPRYVVPRGGH
jgi:hypothetical protein